MDVGIPNPEPRTLNSLPTILLGLLWLSSVSFGQQSQPPKIVGVRVGLADRYKAGLWTQVEVTLRGGSDALSGELSVIVPDGDGVPGRVSTPPSDPASLARSRVHGAAADPLRPRAEHA